MFSLRLVLGIGAAIPRASCGTSRVSSHLIKTTNLCGYATDTENTKSESDSSSVQDSVKAGGFAKAFEKQSQITDTQEAEEPKAFASLLRHSKLMDVSFALPMSIILWKYIINITF